MVVLSLKRKLQVDRWTSAILRGHEGSKSSALNSSILVAAPRWRRLCRCRCLTWRRHIGRRPAKWRAPPSAIRILAVSLSEQAEGKGLRGRRKLEKARTQERLRERITTRGEQQQGLCVHRTVDVDGGSAGEKGYERACVRCHAIRTHSQAWLEEMFDDWTAAGERAQEYSGWEKRLAGMGLARGRLCEKMPARRC